MTDSSTPHSFTNSKVENEKNRQNPSMKIQIQMTGRRIDSVGENMSPVIMKLRHKGKSIKFHNRKI